MCEPTTLIALGMSAQAASTTALVIKGVGMVASVAGKASEAKNKNAAAAQNAQSAKDAYFLKTRQSNLRQLQEQNQASQQKQDADLKALKSQGTALAAAAGGGVQGANVDQLMNDFERSEGVLTGRIQERLDGMASQTAMQNLAFQSEANNRINSMQPQSFAETLFKIAEPIAGYAIDYGDSKARFAAVSTD